MTSVMKSSWFHKKGLGFRSLEAADLVSQQDVLGCKRRFAVLVDPKQPNQPWEIRYFKVEPDANSPCLKSSLEEVIHNPELPLKGVYVLHGSSTVVKLANNVLSIISTERTLLLTTPVEEVGVLQEWFAVLDSYITNQRVTELAETNRRMSTTAGASTTTARRISTAGERARQSLARQVVNPEAAPQNLSSSGLTLESVLADQVLREKFRSFTKSAFAEENIAFYEAVEKHLNVAEDNVPALRTSATNIVNQFVRENSPQQVNLSFNQSQSLIEALENPEMGQLLLCLLQCQHEIQELLRRNFFFRFANQLEQENKRHQMLLTAQGCFSIVFQKAGIDAYTSFLEHFKEMQNDNTLLLQFAKRRYESTNAYIQTSLKPIAFELSVAVIESSSLVTSSTALRSSFDLFSSHCKVLEEFLQEYHMSVTSQLQEMVAHMDESLATITKSMQQKYASILALREKATRFGEVELSSKKAVIEASTKLAELEAQGKKKEKEAKKQAAVFEKLKLDSRQNESGRSECELELAILESDSADDFAQSFISLESLALYRLDTIKDILSKIMFAEQTVLTRLGLKFQTTLTGSAKIDSIKDLLSLAQQVERVSTHRRHMSVSPATQLSARGPEIHVAQPLENVPVAEAIATPRRRWL